MSQLSSYEECRRWLDSHIDFEKLGSHETKVRMPTLERIRELCKYLGDPQDCAPAFHVAGTNGKGSTARIISSLLKEMNLAVGTFTSPDLGGIHERISYDLEPISERDLCEIFNILSGIESQLSVTPTRFELLTAASFSYFANCGVDIQVIEVGLGGKWDSTNVINGMSCVITNIGLDHTEVLGNTKEEIAMEKVGIVKPGSLVTIVEEDKNIADLLEQQAQKRGADKIVSINNNFRIVNKTMAVGGWVIDFETPYSSFSEVYLSLLGEHQINNAVGSIVGTELFFDKSLSDKIVRNTLSKISVPGRLEIVSNNPLVVLDGAHNVHGAVALGKALSCELTFPKNINLIVGILENKDALNMLKSLNIENRVKNVIVVEPNSPRKMSADSLLSLCKQVFVNSYCAVEKSYSKAVDLAKSIDDPDMVLITGSLYVVGDMKSIV